MQVLSEINIDLQRPTAPKIIHAKQGDAFTRGVVVKLYSNGVSWEVPSEVTDIFVAFCKPDGKGGEYNKMPDGSTSACTTDGNTITAKFAPQVLTCAGRVTVDIKMVNSGGDTLKTFGFFIEVESSAESGITSEDYWKNPTLEELNEKIGSLPGLSTTAKSSLVAAINEVNRVALKSVKSVNGVQPDTNGDVAVAAGGLQVARATRGDADAYTATGDLLPDVARGTYGSYTGKGSQIVFIPSYSNSTNAPTLRINGGDIVPIMMRAPVTQNDDDVSPEAAFPIPAGALMTGVPYTMTFCGLYWLVDSYIALPRFIVTMERASDGTLTVDKTFAECKSAYNAGQEIICSAYDHQQQWGAAIRLPVEAVTDASFCFSRFAETDQGVLSYVSAYINSTGVGLNTTEVAAI